jgi:hypothetical protein
MDPQRRCHSKPRGEEFTAIRHRWTVAETWPRAAGAGRRDFQIAVSKFALLRVFEVVVLRLKQFQVRQ